MNLSAQHLDFRIVLERRTQLFGQIAFVRFGKMPGHAREFAQVGIEPRVCDVSIQNAEVPSDLVDAFDCAGHVGYLSPEIGYRIYMKFPARIVYLFLAHSPKNPAAKLRD